MDYLFNKNPISNKIVSLFKSSVLQVFNRTTIKSGTTYFHNTKTFHLLFRELFFSKFSLSFSFRKKKYARVGEPERLSQREIVFLFIYIYLVGRFLSNFSQFQLLKTIPPISLTYWIGLGQPNLGTHPIPTLTFSFHDWDLICFSAYRRGRK